MPHDDRLALEVIFDSVVERFAEDAFDCPNLLGWREPARHKLTERRVVWVPGDPSGSIGVIGAPVGAGRHPRSLGTLDEVFTVYCGAVDRARLEIERYQYRAARLVYEAWLRAVLLAMPGRVRVLSSAWTVPPRERSHGAEIVAVCTVSSAVLDLPPGVDADGSRVAGVGAHIVPSVGGTVDGPGTDDQPVIIDPVRPHES